MNLLEQERYKIYQKTMPSVIILMIVLLFINIYVKDYPSVLLFLALSILISYIYINNFDKIHKYILSFIILYSFVIVSMIKGKASQDLIITYSITGVFPILIVGVLLGRKYLILASFIHSLSITLWCLIKSGSKSIMISYVGLIWVFCILFYVMLKIFENVFDKMTDITENLELEVNKKTEDLRKVNHNLTKFIHSISHEIRTPLTAILPAMNLIRDENSEIIDNINRNLYRVVSLINEVLEIAKYDNDKMNFIMKKNDINNNIFECIDAVSIAYHEKQLYLKFEPNYTIKPFFFDKKRISQCLINILNNALKFTLEGGVRIQLTHDQITQKINIRIKDTGIGIQKEYIDYIFEEFKQVPVEIPWDDSLTNEENIARIPQKGSGLGLSIAKRFIEGHQGVIWIESEGLGYGTTCIIELPTGEFDETG